MHHDGLTVPQIDERLRQPHPDTGQTWHYNRSAIHGIIRRAGEEPHSSRVMSPAAMAELRRLQSSGLTHRQIADAMNELGIPTAHRRPWTDGSVRHAFRSARPSRRAGRAA